MINYKEELKTLRLILILLTICAFAQAQDTTEVAPPDTLRLVDAQTVKEIAKPAVGIDTLLIREEDGVKYVRSLNINELHHSPHTATMYAAILPGLGQIYNHKYWKLPFLYGGVAALCYAIHFNSKYYDLYHDAYRDFVIRDPNNKSYEQIIARTNLTVEQVETTYQAWFSTALKNKKDFYRRYRDLSYFGMVGLYIVQIIDACVDAHFYDFNVNDDLSYRFTPMITEEYGSPVVGASLVIQF